MSRTQTRAQTGLRSARQLAAWLRERFGRRIADIRLFGSWARGEADEDSDVDVLAVFEEPPTREEREEISWRRYDIDLENGTVTSLLVETRETWEGEPFRGTSLRRAMEREGVAL